MLQATFRADAHAIRLLSQQFNQMCDLLPELNHGHKLTFIPGQPECGVSGDANSVMRFIGNVASFGSNCLVRVETPQPVRAAVGQPTIPTHHMEFEVDPYDNTQMHVRLNVCPLPGESWPDTIMKYDFVWKFKQRAVTPDRYYGAAIYTCCPK